MKIFIKKYNSFYDNTISVDVEPNDSILNLKKKFFEKYDYYPVDEFTFIFAGKYLLDNRSLSDYNIQNESTLFQHIPCGRCGGEAIKTGNINDIKSKLNGEKGVFLIIKCDCSNEEYFLHLNLELNKEYDIRKNPLKCPSCDKNIICLNVKSVALYQCLCIFYNYLISRTIESSNKDEYKYKDNTQTIFTLTLLELYDN